MSGDTVRSMAAGIRWREIGWALPWLLFQAFPLVDLFDTPRPTAVRVVAGVGLAAFTLLYLDVFRRAFGCHESPRGRLVVLAVLGIALAVWLGPSWAGLMIYVSAAAGVTLPVRWVFPASLAAAVFCAATLWVHGDLGDLFILPVMCVLTAFALQGTRHLISINAELTEARDELARNAVAEERLRFARDLHDLLGHSLSLIALKSELAGRLAERDPARAREEMADVEAAARRALAEVRDAVSGYRQISVAQAVAEARSALSAAGIALRAPSGVPSVPAKVDAVLGWVVREATTNVLRHSRASTVTIRLDLDERAALLVVSDDGVGSTAAPGAGLSGLAERVESLGGRLESGPAGTHGFRLAAQVPLGAAVERVAVP
jgi:two-component system sensor histidine kinase DesK